MTKTQRIARKPLAIALGVALGCVGLAHEAHAGLIKVSQETAAGSGIYSVLGYIEAFTTADTTAGYYNYGAQASFNGPAPALAADASQLFFLDASDGLSLVVLHDSKNSGSGGSASMQWDLVGDTAAYRVQEREGDSYTINAAGDSFTANSNWAGCCADGFAIGSIDGGILEGEFTQFSGLSTWAAASAGGSQVSLALETGQAVRLEQVPEPATLGLLGLGLAAAGGLGLRRRRKH